MFHSTACSPLLLASASWTKCDEYSSPHGHWVEGWRGDRRFRGVAVAGGFRHLPVPQSVHGSVSSPRPSHRTWGFPPSGAPSRVRGKGYETQSPGHATTSRLGSGFTASTAHRSPRGSTLSRDAYLFASAAADSQACGLSLRPANERSSGQRPNCRDESSPPSPARAG